MQRAQSLAVSRGFTPNTGHRNTVDHGDPYTLQQLKPGDRRAELHWSVRGRPDSPQVGQSVCELPRGFDDNQRYADQRQQFWPATAADGQHAA